MKNKNELATDAAQTLCPGTAKSQAKKEWQKPKLEDVSGKVMAQPYIRFT